MRALCDAIIVGAGTVAADDPQLTTRRVAGPSPLRVIFDPTRGLGEHYRVFSDASAETLYVCARSLTRPGESHFGRASLVAIDDDEDQGAGVDVADLLRLLRQRGCTRIFVEGGGVTVSTFLEAEPARSTADRDRSAHHRRRTAGHSPGAPRGAARLPAPELSRVPHGRRRPVRLRPPRLGRQHARRTRPRHAHHLNVGLRPTPRLGRLRGPDAPRRSLAGAPCAPPLCGNENRILVRSRITV